MKRVFWRVAKRLSYIEDAQCLKVNSVQHNRTATWDSVLLYCQPVAQKRDHLWKDGLRSTNSRVACSTIQQGSSKPHIYYRCYSFVCPFRLRSKELVASYYVLCSVCKRTQLSGSSIEFPLTSSALLYVSATKSYDIAKKYWSLALQPENCVCVCVCVYRHGVQLKSGPLTKP